MTSLYIHICLANQCQTITTGKPVRKVCFLTLDYEIIQIMATLVTEIERQRLESLKVSRR
jgi:hypothetical protein